MTDVERERLEHNIEYHRRELRRALRDLGVSVLISLNLPRRIRRRPLPWALAGIGLTAFLVLRARQRARAPRWRFPRARS